MLVNAAATDDGDGNDDDVGDEHHHTALYIMYALDSQNLNLTTRIPSGVLGGIRTESY